MSLAGASGPRTAVHAPETGYTPGPMLRVCGPLASFFRGANQDPQEAQRKGLPPETRDF